MRTPIRILSDLHFGHHASFLRRPEQLVPLFTDAATVIFNGDSFETRTPICRAESKPLIDETAALVKAAGIEAIFINGNHDPALAHHNFLDLADGRVFVTHGDILYDDVAPWSSHARHLSEVTRRIRATLPPEDLADLAKLLAAHKRAAVRQAEESGRSNPDINRGPLLTALSLCWPPLRPIKMLRAWQSTARRAHALRDRHRPHARVILLGHTHRPGIWRRDDLTIINTGSFLPPLGCFAVDIDERTVAVRPIKMDRGRFELGAASHHIAL